MQAVVRRSAGQTSSWCAFEAGVHKALSAFHISLFETGHAACEVFFCCLQQYVKVQVELAFGRCNTASGYARQLSTVYKMLWCAELTSRRSLHGL